MAKRRTTLKRLYRMAQKDPRFFDALIRNPRKAIKAKGLAVNAPDIRRLERSLRKVYKLTGKQIAEALVLGKAENIPGRARIRGR